MNATEDIATDAPATDTLHHLSDGQVNTIYTAAYQLSERGRHDQACALFALLRMYRPQEAKYSHAVGICFRKLGSYEQAIPFFASAMELKPDDFAPAFQLIECLMLLGRREQAMQVLQAVASGGADYAQEAATERARALMSLITEHQP
jgi:type III secretion system low calcium response chaperone LcrH/SycD